MILGGFFIIGGLFGAAILGSVLGTFGAVVGFIGGGVIGYKIGRFFYTH